MPKEKRNLVIKKIRIIINLAEEGLDPATIMEVLNKADLPVTRDYVSHTIKSWELSGKSGDPEVVRLKILERKKARSKQDLPESNDNTLTWIANEIMTAKVERQLLMSQVEDILKILQQLT